ncbi:hypothetical protein NBRC116584_28890 [Hydrogenophaga sp. 5NK40-0174]
MQVFEPSAARGQLLDRGMCDDLVSSLRHLLAAAQGDGLTGNLQQILTLLETGVPFRPVAFGLYFQLAQAMLGEEHEKALSTSVVLLEHLKSLRASAADENLIMVGRGSRAAALLEEVFEAQLGSEADCFAPVTEQVVENFRARMASALALLADGVPGLHGELQAILRDVLVAQGQPDADTVFDGASHYQFWGLLLLNPEFHNSRLALAEVLAHESGHSVLFGLSRLEPLVLNADDETFESPLRVDARPMDGIFHATYVCARMAWTMHTLLESGLLDQAERAEALRALEQDHALFDQGWETVAAHGQLSPTGEQIMQGAKAWMDRSRPVLDALLSDLRPTPA